MKKLYTYIIIIITSTGLSGNTIPVYEEEHWKQLLHIYNNNHTVKTKTFFLSKKTKPTAKEELDATILAFKKSKSMVCKYPARYQWLKSKVKLPQHDLSSCKNLEAYYKNFKDKEVYYLYEVGSMDSPRLLFGHGALLFKKHDESYDDALILKVTIDSGKDFFFTFMYKVLTYHYETQIKVNLFYKDLYKEMIRDTEYIVFKYDFTNDEIKKMIYHLYELKDINFYYQYKNINCESIPGSLLNTMTEDKRKDFFINIPLNNTHKYNHRITEIGLIDFDQYKFPYPVPNFDKNESLRYLKSIYPLMANYQTIKSIKLKKVKKVKKKLLIEPSKISLGVYLDDSEKLLALNYMYLNKDTKYKYQEHEERVSFKSMGIRLDIAKNKLYIDKITLLEFEKESFYKKESIYIYSGIDRENKSNKLRWNNELGGGLAYRINGSLTSRININLGFQNYSVYIKPTIDIEYELSKNKLLTTKMYYRSYQDYFHADMRYQVNYDFLYLRFEYTVSSNEAMDGRSVLSLGYYFE